MILASRLRGSRMSGGPAERKTCATRRSTIARGGFSPSSSSHVSQPPRPGAESERLKEVEGQQDGEHLSQGGGQGDAAKVTQPRRAASSSAAKGERCEPAMKEGFSALDADALKNAADGSIDVEIDGDSATPRGAYPFKTFFGRASRSSSGLAPSYARRAVAECFSRSRSRRAVVRGATTACPRVVAASPSPR
jgi:hypothetical protein